MYWFVHGLPTDHPGSWMPDTGKPSCGSAACEALFTIWSDMRRGGSSWEERVNMECEECQAERARRARVLLDRSDRRHEEEPFLSAPYVHPFYAPKYQAQVRRAVLFTKQTSRCVLWVVAQDRPFRCDESQGSAPLSSRRETWLK